MSYKLRLFLATWPLIWFIIILIKIKRCFCINLKNNKLNYISHNNYVITKTNEYKTGRLRKIKNHYFPRNTIRNNYLKFFNKLNVLNNKKVISNIFPLYYFNPSSIGLYQNVWDKNYEQALEDKGYLCKWNYKNKIKIQVKSKSDNEEDKKGQNEKSEKKKTNKIVGKNKTSGNKKKISESNNTNQEEDNTKSEINNEQIESDIKKNTGVKKKRDSPKKVDKTKLSLEEIDYTKGKKSTRKKNKENSSSTLEKSSNKINDDVYTTPTNNNSSYKHSEKKQTKYAPKNGLSSNNQYVEPIKESNIGKSFEGIVSSVNEGAAYIKISDLNSFGVLFKNKSNLGNDIEDMNNYFKVNQKVTVKILGVNLKKNIYYLGNIIKYNKDIILEKGDRSKGLITKICESYCFIKILKNGSVGYLHRSKIRFLNNYILNNLDDTKKSESANLNNNDLSFESLLDVTSLEMQSKLTKLIQFQNIFKIWDIIDIEILSKSEQNLSSSYILTIPKETNTFKRVLEYAQSGYKQSQMNPTTSGNKQENSTHISPKGILNVKKKINDNPQQNLDDFTNIDGKEIMKDTILNTSNDYINIQKKKKNNKTIYNLEDDKILMKKEKNKINENFENSVKKKKKKKDKEKEKLTKTYQLPNNNIINLSMLSKIIKISPSSLKKFFIINEKKEFSFNSELTLDQIKKACDYFEIQHSSVLPAISHEKSNEIDTASVNEIDTTSVNAIESVENKSSPSLISTSNSVSLKMEPGEDIKNKLMDEKEKKRNIVVTFIGHINHGKTSLFDYICKTNERNKEHGLITQNIRAFKANINENSVCTFIDTPGHEAFIPIRQRGIQISDLSILVISGEEGIQAQTIECIKLIKELNIKIIIAITKTDIPNIDVNRIINDLLYYDISTEINGGEIQVVECSIYKEDSINKLLDAIYLESEFIDLSIKDNEKAEGVVLDSYVGKNGIVSINLLQKGVLKLNDNFYTGSSYGKIKVLKNYMNKNIKCAYPSDPVIIIGYNKNSLPIAGDKFHVVESETIAKEISEHNKDTILSSQINDFNYSMPTLDKYENFIINPEETSGNDISDQNNAETQQSSDKNSDTHENDAEPNDDENKLKDVYINYFIKCDKQGTIDILKNSILKLSKEDTIYRIRNKIIYANIGDISSSDINYALSFDAIIIGFNVKIAKNVKSSKNNGNSQFIFSNVLYELIENVENEMTKRLSKKPTGKYIGKAKILKIFNISKLGKISGCSVINGTIKNNSNVRILRDGHVIYVGKIISLKVVKEERAQVNQNEECGMAFENFTDFNSGDIIEAYEEE
ncbi:sporozoite surface antigen MB2, putative [Plasmodium chabaudi chabaudi]|uniref:Translation initiation factor IF-2, putative n=3 Tax=Plasmodium chabaudi TaxID=5825 RepID=A0A4V0K9D4_PLACU|nr:sporozoite surface antigen MB2, putative [Plasmodium chabaudi chabaudi]VTZ69791.1 sporozoite surface antigen MB2, putative [Plasmodium chabaudi chabaudi]|eukprot:XP_016654310.1 sporozoite surface antigen MB2, putative [Plasmodium chabaudi chabaudi]